MPKLNEKNGTIIITSITVSLIIVVILLDDFFKWSDIDNQYTIIVEIAVGGIIAFITLKRTGRDTTTITKLIEKINEYEEKQKEFLGELEKTRNARISFYGTKLVNNFERVQKCFNDLEKLPESELQKLNIAFFDKFKPAHIITINTQNQNIEFPNLPFFDVMKEDLHIIESDLPPEISFFAGRTLEMAQFCLFPLSGKIQIGDGLWKIVKEEDMPKVIDRLNSMIVDKKPLKDYGVRFFRMNVHAEL